MACMTLFCAHERLQFLRGRLGVGVLEDLLQGGNDTDEAERVGIRVSGGGRRASKEGALKGFRKLFERGVEADSKMAGECFEEVPIMFLQSFASFRPGSDRPGTQ